jgi:hypothetical protein
MRKAPDALSLLRRPASRSCSSSLDLFSESQSCCCQLCGVGGDCWWSCEVPSDGGLQRGEGFQGGALQQRGSSGFGRRGA